MKCKRTALLLLDHSNDFHEMVKVVLETLSVRPVEVCRCREAESHLASFPLPHLVLTDPVLPDGTWEDVLRLARRAPNRVNVVVVSRIAELPLYLDVMSEGAYDFVTHAFTVPELVHVLRCALDDAARSRKGKSVFSRSILIPNPLEPSTTL
jgi:DNA-binding NtrC family response regulator